jgi:hypothetical protein
LERLRRAIDRARIGQTDKVEALRSLDEFTARL